MHAMHSASDTSDHLNGSMAGSPERTLRSAGPATHVRPVRAIVVDGSDAHWEYLRRCAARPTSGLVAVGHWPEVGSHLTGTVSQGDVVAVDPWSVGREVGVEVVAALRQHGARVLVLTDVSMPVPLSEAVEAGATGVYLKRDGVAGLPDAVRRVGAGFAAYSSDHARRSVSTGRLPTLTQTQRATLAGFAAGYSAAEIARFTHRSVRTVNNHMADIAQAYGRVGRNGPGGALWLGRQGRVDGYHLSRHAPRGLDADTRDM